MFYEPRAEQLESNVMPMRLKSFLNRVDAVYMKAFQTCSVSCLKPFCNQEAIKDLSNVIYRNPDRFFGGSKFRNTEWTILRKENDTYTVRKDVSFNKVHICGVSLSVSSEYAEEWTVVNLGRDYIITNIEEVQVR